MGECRIVFSGVEWVAGIKFSAVPGADYESKDQFVQTCEWQELRKLIDSDGFLVPLCRGKALMQSQGYLTMSTVPSASSGLKWDIYKKDSEQDTMTLLNAQLAAFPDLASGDHGEFKGDLDKSIAK